MISFFFNKVLPPSTRWLQVRSLALGHHQRTFARQSTCQSLTFMACWTTRFPTTMTGPTGSPPLEDLAYVVNSDVRGGVLLHKAPPFAKTHAHIFSTDCIKNHYFVDRYLYSWMMWGTLWLTEQFYEIHKGIYLKGKLAPSRHWYLCPKKFELEIENIVIINSFLSKHILHFCKVVGGSSRDFMSSTLSPLKKQQKSVVLCLLWLSLWNWLSHYL